MNSQDVETVSDRGDPTVLVATAIDYATALQRRHDNAGVHGAITSGAFREDRDGHFHLQAPTHLDIFALPNVYYASPEQVGRLAFHDERSDLYSLGVVLYKLFTGHYPVEGTNTLTIVHHHMAVAPEPAIHRNTHLPRVLSEIVAKLLAKSPQARYASCRGLLEDLQTCQRGLLTTGNISPMVLGTADKQSQFLIPDKLYGREAEIAILDETFDRAMRGEIVLAMVGGYSGIGKSALVRAMRDHVRNNDGFLVEGKFDQYQRETPYSALLEAFRSLVRTVLAGPKHEIRKFSDQVDALLGENAQVIIDVLPEVELLIGSRGPAPELSDAAARERFNHLFSELLKLFASKDHPLVLFLDDLQWVDFASLALIQTFVKHGVGAHLLMVGAYRDNEVDSSHPLTLALEDLRRDGAPLYEFWLGPLEHEHITALIRDTCEDLDNAEELADLVMHKTDGNPFFARQFLKTMHVEEALVFDHDTSRWTWNPGDVRLRDAAENVVDLMMNRIGHQSAEGQLALKIAACIGKRFDLTLLAAVADQSLEHALAAVAGALHDELLFPVPSEPNASPAFQFAHDRVQQAAYSQHIGPEHSQIHLAIGRALWATLTDTDEQNKLFAVADQINVAGDLLADADERLRVAELNLAVGRRARSSLAYRAASRYLEEGLRHLPARRAWKDHYDLAFGLYSEIAAVYSLLNEETLFQQAMAVLLNNVTDSVDRLEVRICQTSHYCLSSQLFEGLDVGCIGLAEVGIDVPAHTDREALTVAFVDGLAQFRRRVSGHDVGQLLYDLPIASDPLSERVMRLIGAMADAATITNTPLLSLLSVIGANRSLEHGNTRLSPLLYTLLGQGMIAHERAYLEARALIETAIRLSDEKLPDLWSYGRSRVHQFWFVLHWSQHIDESLEPIEAALAVTRRAHDPLYAAYLLNVAAITRYFMGSSTEEVLAAHDRVVEHCQPYSMEVIIGFTQCYAGAAAALRGETDSLTSLSGEHVDEEEFRQRFRDMSMIMGLQIGARIPLYGLAEEWEQVLKLADDRNVGLSPPFIPHVPIQFWSGVAAARILAEATTTLESRPDHWHRLDHSIEYLKEIRDGAAPANVAHRLMFLQAEKARAEGHDWQAVSKYFESIDLADAAGYRIEAAYFREALAAFLQRVETASTGHVLQLLVDAEKGYRHAQAYELASRASVSVAQFQPAEPIGEIALDRVDTLAILEAGLAINRHMELPSLLDRLLTIIMEFSGAERGAIARLHRGELTIERSVGVFRSKGLPNNLLRFVANTSQPVILNDPARVTESSPASEFSSEPYFQKHRPLSVSCQAIDRREPVRRVLYLEHRLLPNVFAPRQQEVLSLLCSQAAISIENAELYSGLEAQVSERTAELEAANRLLVEQRAELEKARDEAEQAARAKAEFLANMSHEIRTPLNTVMGMSDLALETELSDEARRYLGDIRFSAGHLLEILDDILDFSRIDAGKVSLEQSPFSLEAALTDVTNLVGFKAFEKGLELIYEVEESVLDLFSGDERRIKQVLINLINNAVGFTESGSIVVRVAQLHQSATAAELEFHVTDTGSGIAPDAQRNLFEFFSQVDSSQTRRRGGTGLGLAISKALVEEMGGRIACSSVPGEGSTFYFTVKLKLPTAEEIEQSDLEHLNLDLTRQVPSTDGMRALIVDKRPLARSSAAKLAEDLGFEVAAHASLDQALVLLDRAVATTNDRIDVIIVDRGIGAKEVESLGTRLKQLPSEHRPLGLLTHEPGAELSVAPFAGPTRPFAADLAKPLLRGPLSRALAYAIDARAERLQETESNSPSWVEVGQHLPLSHKRVLIVEDNELTQSMMTQFMARVNIESVPAMNGQEAIDILERDPNFDCVVMDCHMPVLNGFDATRIVRASASYGDIPIIGLTGDVLAANRIHLSEQGQMDAIVSKPFNFEELLTLIGELADARAARTP